MHPHVRYLEETRDFIRENLTAISQEYFEWQTTDKLNNTGKFREAAQKLGIITSIGKYGKNSYVSGRLKVVESIMFDMLLKQHLIRAGYFGENI